MIISKILKRSALIALVALCVDVNAQAPKKLTLDNVIAGGKTYRNFIPEYKYYNFLGTTDNLIQTVNDTVFSVSSKNTNSVFVTLDNINKALKEQNHKQIKSLHSVKWINEKEFWVNNGEQIIVFTTDINKVLFAIDFPAGAQHLDFNLQRKALAYIHNHNLYVAEPNNEAKLIAKGSENGIVLGQSVHRNEFGIHNGMFWSPKGNSLAFYRMDETMVTDYPLVETHTRIAEVKNIKYPMAGTKSHQVTLGVYNLNTQKTIYLNTGEPKEKYLTNIAWTPSETNILIAELNREQNHAQLKMYDAVSGEFVKQLFEEKSDTWVEPEVPALFLPNSASQFVWQSEKDGYNHLYLYDINKGLIKQLTQGNWVVTKVLGFDAKAKKLYFEATKDGGVLCRNIYELTLSNKKIVRLSKQDGTHSATISKSGNKIIDNFSAVSTPRIIQLIDTKKRTAQQLLEAKNPYQDYNFGKIVMDTITSADGSTELYSRMILPPNFDASKKYPVVVYVYGGPHAQLVKNSWLGAARTWQLYMAQQGYIAFALDNRGTPDRGCEFEKVIHRKLGEAEVADQMEGVKYLKSLPYVDANRIGVHGWSYGGFMTINLMEKYPDVFKVGVSGGPVTDWKYYEIMYGERYMDSPAENPEGYKNSNLNLRTKNIEGRLLVIHGAMDPVVVWQHSLDFTEQCIKNNIQIDYFVYPKHEHNVIGPDRIHLMQKVTTYFEDFL